MLEQFQLRMQNLLQDEYESFLEALKQPNLKGIYLNHRYDINDDFISNFNLQPHHYVNDGYIYDYNQFPLGKLSYFDCGLYYIQEPSAMIVASLLDLKKGDKVLDLCAAPGGKTCYVASRLDGLMITNDINESRAKILSENVERFGLSNTIVLSEKPAKLTKYFPGYFDKIILDAPCSGEGMFRKLDQAVDTWSIDKVHECASIQKELIDYAYTMLKKDGILVYSTCTYSKEENEDIINYMLDHYDVTLLPILKQNGMQEGIGLKEVVRLYPHKHAGEGHFIALIQKNGESNSKNIKLAKGTLKKDKQKYLDEFYKQYLNIKVPSTIIDNNNHLYALVKDAPDLSGLKVLRNGLYLGEIKKNRFEPSYSLSHTLTIKDVKQYYSYPYDHPNIIKYLKGETIEGTNQKGYGVLFVENYPLAFYKESNGQAKNLFPKGLRKQY